MNKNIATRKRLEHINSVMENETQTTEGKMKYKYKIVKLCQSGQLRGHESAVWSTSAKIQHTNRREAEKVAKSLNRSHGIDTETAEEIYTVSDI